MSSDNDKKTSSNDKETISRLREALANMNKDYMQTKLELDQMKGSKSSSDLLLNTNTTSSTSNTTPQKPDLGAHFLKISSKVKAFQSNINTKLATAGIQINNLSSNNNDNNELEEEQEEEQQPQIVNNNDKETRRLRDDIESLETQMKNLKTMLKQSMEEKDQLQKERNELLIKYGEADEQIKRLKQQSNSDANRYEQLLDSFRAENSTQIENEKKKLYKECDDKINNLNTKCNEYKEKYEKLQKEWDENEDNWNNKFDLIVTERNSLKRKVKSLQNDLSEYIHNNGNHHIMNNHNMNSIDNNNNNQDDDQDQDEEEELKINNNLKIKEIEKLKNQISELKKSHNNEKTALLNNIQRLSSKTTINSKGSDMQILVNSLSSLISEKEEIIQSLTQSKKSLGKMLLAVQEELKQFKK